MNVYFLATSVLFCYSQLCNFWSVLLLTCEVVVVVPLGVCIYMFSHKQTVTAYYEYQISSTYAYEETVLDVYHHTE